MKHAILPKCVGFSCLWIRVPVIQLPFCTKNTNIIHQDIHTFGLHRPEALYNHFPSILFSYKLGLNPHVSITIMFTVCLDRRPKCGWCHNRIWPIHQQICSLIGRRPHPSAALIFLIEFKRHFSHRLRQNLQTGKICGFCNRPRLF